jgi:3-dehydroquinate synthase
MKKKSFRYSSGTVDFYFDAEFNHLSKLVSKAQTVLITDENLHHLHKKKFEGWKTIVVRAGEAYKNQQTADFIIGELIKHEADRETFLVGIGGGVVTDITGYVAAVYMRGIRFGFMPTSILAMVDASIGGKNGIDVGVYKNLIGTIRQPSFLLYDYSFLRSLPRHQWVNGFAEIIKHACIKDASLFRELQLSTLTHYRKDDRLVGKLIQKNASIKSAVVEVDEFEKSDRRLLNFGHTLGHAVETRYELPHGHAIAIGMVAACRISEKLRRFRDTDKVISVLKQYGLPVKLDFDKKQVFEILKMDKKKVRNEMRYILLSRIGKAEIESIPLEQLENLINQL